jgi:hypothetical protein
MKLSIEIELDNDVFTEPHYRKFELNNILNELCDKVYYARYGKRKIMDSNGNTVGHFTLSKN